MARRSLSSAPQARAAIGYYRIDNSNLIFETRWARSSPKRLGIAPPTLAARRSCADASDSMRPVEREDKGEALGGTIPCNMKALVESIPGTPPLRNVRHYSVPLFDQLRLIVVLMRITNAVIWRTPEISARFKLGLGFNHSRYFFHPHITYL